MKCQGEKIDYLHQLILRLMGLIYAFAFSSWYYQIPQLYGQNGLMPLSQMKWYNFTQQPTLLQFSKSETTLSIITIIGTILGLIVFLKPKFVKWYNFSLLWMFYLSLYSVGQDFSQFQWDIMLLEGGFLCIIFCITPIIGRELLRWLAFRLYFSSGLVKLLSQCETWWNLTALHHHFASQCIPHFISWWAHQLPGEIKKFMVAGNFYILIFGALYLYFPLRSIRIFGFLLQCLMQISIILTGNYNYFNLLSIVITMVVLDDCFIYRYFPKVLKKFIGMPQQIVEFHEDKKIYKYSEMLLCIYMTGVIIFNLFFESIISNKKLPFKISDIGEYFITEDNIGYFLLYVLTFFFFYLTYFNIQKQSNNGIFKIIIITLTKILIFVGMFSMSNMTFQQGIGIKHISSPLIPQEYLQTVQSYIYPYHLFNQYGLFRKMTGVNGRPELIFQGSSDGSNWQEYEFYYKPGQLNTISPFVIPHQPRLDWQLWFAAFHEHPSDLYLIHLVYKMLDGQQIDEFVSKNPFKNKPPQYVRILKYHYFFTNISEMRETGQFWKRVYKNEYLPPITKQDTQLQQLKDKYQFEKASKKISNKNKIPLWSLILKQVCDEYTLYRRYIQHLQSKLDESKPKQVIQVHLNREEAFEIDIKVKRNRDELPLRTNHYKSISNNIRLQMPVPVLLERLTPLSIPTKMTDEIEEHIQHLEQSISKSIEDSKNYLRLEYRVFLDFLFQKLKIEGIQSVFKLQPIAQSLGCSIEQLQQYYLQKIANEQQSEFSVKYQFVRFNRYFCPICNLYLCSLHYNSKNQRLYIEKEPEEENLGDNLINHDNYYESEFKPCNQLLRELSNKYKLNNKIELEYRCNNTQQCGKYTIDQQKLKKFQIRAIEQMIEFGFSNCCFMNKILQHRIYQINCNQIQYLIKTVKLQKRTLIGKPKKQQQIKKQNINNYAQQYIPCFHEGECGTNICTCITCHRYCCCKGNCQQKIKSCDCRQCGYDEKKQKHMCPCFLNGYECDPQICKCQSCQNQNLLLQIRKKFVLGKSLICNGMGLFAGQEFLQQEFVGEYIGNYILLDEESIAVEQCDWITNNHYLFEVDDKWQVDGTYYSNNLRYINHAAKKSELVNCQAQILFSEGRWRIAMFTTKNIGLGEELFFDYGDKFLTGWLSEFNKLCDDYYRK